MLSDNQIIEQVNQGDIQAYRHLVDRYRDMAFTIALKLMKNEAQAEEISQEAFIKAYEKLRSFKGASSFSTWLYTIVYRTGIYHLRKQRTTVSLDNPTIDPIVDAKNASEALIDQEEKTQVKDAIDQLPRLEAMIITLYYMDEKSIEEIAQITELTKSNIKVKLFRARKKLKSILNPIL